MQIAGASSMAPVAMLEAAQVPAPPKERKTRRRSLSAWEMAVGGERRPAPVAPPDPRAGSEEDQATRGESCSGRFGRRSVDGAALNATDGAVESGGDHGRQPDDQSFADILYGKPGNKRDEDIEKIKQSIVAAGKVGLPVIEYNFYAHRAMEGYFEEIDTARGNSGWTGFDYELVQTAKQQYQSRPEEKGMKFKDLPPLPHEGAHTLDEMWANSRTS